MRVSMQRAVRFSSDRALYRHPHLAEAPVRRSSSIGFSGLKRAPTLETHVDNCNMQLTTRLFRPPQIEFLGA